MPKKNPLIMIPGPTPIPQSILKAIAKQPIKHRSDEFISIMEEIYTNLKYIFQTKNDIFIFTSSGTGAMCGALENLLNPKDRILCLVTGKFGERWAEIAKLRGAEVDILSCNFGEVITPQMLENYLNSHKPYKAITLTHSETSTGVANDLQSLCAIIKKTKSLCIVDGISSICAMPCKMDEWGIDILVSGSQKGFMLPPGLAFLALSTKAYEIHKKCLFPSFYFNFSLYKESLKKNTTPFTPSINLIFGLLESLRTIKNIGLENLYHKHKKHTFALRDAIRAIGLELLVKNDLHASYATTSIIPPNDIKAQTIIKYLQENYNIIITGGQGELEEKIFRIGTLGHIQDEDLIKIIIALEQTLKNLGYKFEKQIGLKTLLEKLKIP